MIIAGASCIVKYCIVIKSLLLISGTSATFQNNVIYKTAIEAKNSCTIQNTIGYNDLLPAQDIIIDSGKTITGQYNCFQDATKSGTGTYTDTGTLWSTDPLFIDPTNGDFYLQSTSPSINAGMDVGLTQDYEGNPVPRGNIIRPILSVIKDNKRLTEKTDQNVDIGAYEYHNHRR